MRALVTGAAGFIGSHLSEELLGRGQQVIAIDDLSTGSLSNIDHLQKVREFSFHHGSVLDSQELSAVIEQADLIYHLAAAVGVRYVLEHPVASLVTNARGTENVLRLAEEHGNKPVVLASSSEVYGKTTKVPFIEGDDCVIGATSVSRWGYSCSKALDEFLALAYHREKSLPVVVLRLFNTVGPRQSARYGMVLPRFVAQALAGDPITVYGDGQQTRSFTYVKDVVKAMADIALVPGARGQVFNLGSDREITIDELAQLVRRLLNSDSEIIHVPFSEVYGTEFEEARRRLADISKIQNHISYRPSNDLAHVINEIADDMKLRPEAQPQRTERLGAGSS